MLKRRVTDGPRVADGSQDSIAGSTALCAGSPSPSGEVGDIPDPHPIRAAGGAGAQPIRVLIEEPMQRRIGPIDAGHPRPEPGGAHEACNPPAAHAPPFSGELAVNPGTPIAAVMRGEVRPDPPGQRPVLLRMRAPGPVPPPIRLAPFAIHS